jgi:selenocysteine-specific elongation factor
LTELVVGTAGHIDHGKTALVAALTGIDCDRLEEEHRRGMTIELGFAPWLLPSGRRVSIVDVPGHERFIRTMAVGARSTDLALLCVAADDGVMPQTKEHAAILSVLTVRRALVAVTKLDLDPLQGPRVGEEAVQLLQELGIAATRWIGVSTLRGTGLAELAQAVDSELEVIGAPADRGCPRLLVDRSFSQTGTGTVVTGVLDGGRLHLGDSVEVFPSGARGRVQAMQRRHQAVDSAEPGGRLALALNGVTVKAVPRGSVVGLPGAARPSSHLDCLLQVPRLGAHGLRQGMRMELLCGTAAVPAQVWLAGEDRLPPGTSGYGQLQLASALWALPGDRFVLRAPSPAAVLGGGVVLDPHPVRHHRWTKAPLDSWAARERVLAEAGQQGPLQLAVLEACLAPLGLDSGEAARRAGVPEPAARVALEAARTKGRLMVVGRRYLEPERWGEVCRRALEEVTEHERLHRLGPGLSRRQLLLRLGFDAGPDGDAVMRRLQAEEVLDAHGPLVTLVGHSSLGPRTAGVDRIAAVLRRAGPLAPGALELREAGLSREVSAYLVRSGEAVHLGRDVLISSTAVSALEAQLKELMAATPEGLTVGVLREQLHTSRRVLVPLLEQMAHARVTVRVGDLHQLNQEAQCPISSD